MEYKMCFLLYYSKRYYIILYVIDFPAIFKPKDVENGWYDTWQRNKYFASSKKRRTSNSTQEEKEIKEPFSMILPPPNITGILHLGHALTVIIQDVLARWLVKVY